MAATCGQGPARRCRLLGPDPHPSGEGWLRHQRGACSGEGRGLQEGTCGPGGGRGGQDTHEVYPIWVVGLGTAAGACRATLITAGSKICQEPLVTPGRRCWTHRRSLGARGPRGLRGTCTGRREGRAGLSILLGERRPPPLNGPFPQFLFDPRAQGIHGHQGPGSLQTHPWEAGGEGEDLVLGAHPPSCLTQAPNRTPSLTPLQATSIAKPGVGTQGSQ